MKVEIWKSENEISVFEHTKSEKERSIILETDSVFVRFIEGKDWNDCMRQHHELMGWEPYKHM